MAINDALSLKTARRDAIASLNSLHFWGFESELHNQLNVVSFRFAVGRHVDAA